MRAEKQYTKFFYNHVGNKIKEFCELFFCRINRIWNKQQVLY